MSGPFSLLVNAPDSAPAPRTTEAENLFFSNTRTPGINVKDAASRSTYIPTRPAETVWGLGSFNARQYGGNAPVGEGALVRTETLPTRDSVKLEDQGKNLLEFHREDHSNIVNVYNQYDGFVDQKEVQEALYFTSALGTKLGQNWFDYPTNFTIGNFTAHNILGKFAPISWTYAAGPVSLVYNGSMTEVVLDPAHRDDPLKAFGRMRNYLENRQDGFAVSSEAIIASAPFNDHFPELRAPETANFVRVNFNFLTQFAYNFGVQLGEGHWLGGREMPDPTAGSLLRNPIDLRSKQVLPTYTRPLFDDSYKSFHFRIGQPVGVALASGASFHYQDWPLYFTKDAQGQPVESWRIDLFDFSNTSQ